MLSTAGGLVFYTSQNADFQAVNAASGEILYSVNLGTSPKSGPITYMLDGKQHVVQAVGGVPGWGYEEHGLEHGNLIVALSRKTPVGLHEGNQGARRQLRAPFFVPGRRFAGSGIGDLPIGSDRR